MKSLSVLSLCLIFGASALGQAPYCSAGGTGFNCAFDEYISNVTVGVLNNTSTCSGPPGYSDFTGLTGPTFPIGVAVPISVTVSTFFATDVIDVYVDWNGDNDFVDAGEVVSLVQGPVGPNVTFTGNITAPVGAVSNTRMRVTLRYNVVGAPNPCFVETFGEAEDYTVGPPACQLVFSSPAGPGSLQIDNIACAAAANQDYQIAVTFAPGSFPNGWFFGLDIGFQQLIDQHGPSFQNILWGTLDGSGASSFGPVGGLPSGLTIYGVTAHFASGFGLNTGSRTPVSYTIP